MKKNISINISGIIFHIEEDGYDILKKYLDSINKYFASFEDSSEILADIESRIAEIFLGKLNEGKQIITHDDVQALMATMGSVSDFQAAEEKGFAEQDTNDKQQASSSFDSQSYSYTPPKSFVRDQKRKILGGVCAGLAHYWSIDVVWVRLLFALLSVFYGVALLVYIILWIALPPAYDLEEVPVTKKLFRDPDKKVLGGVASGLSAYFGIDVVVVRVLFIIFSVFGGLGLALYIIMWIVFPTARTLTDKLQMQGEPVTLSNIESNIKKNLNVKENEEESVLVKILLFPFRLIGSILTMLGKILVPIAEVLRVAIGVFITMIGLTLVFGTVVTGGILLGLVSFSSGWVLGWDEINFPIEALTRVVPPFTSLMAFIGALIPAVIVTLLGISLIAKRIVFNAAVGWGLFVLFFISSVSLSISIPKIVFGFKEEGEHKVEQVYNLQGKTAVLTLKEVGMDDYDATSLTLRGYEGNEIKLVQAFEAQGSSRMQAIENAKMVNYNVSFQDSVFTFDSNIRFKEDAEFRAQRLKMTMYIPFNQPFKLEDHFYRLLSNYIDYERRSGNTWMFTERGLECVSCPVKVITDNNGNQVKDEYGLEDFNELVINGFVDVNIYRGHEYAVEVSGPSREKEMYDLYVRGDRLVVEYKRQEKFTWRNSINQYRKVTINIMLPELNKLEVNGAGDVTVKEFTEDDLEIELNGAVDMKAEINVRNLMVDLNGASKLDLRGEGTSLEANLIGASVLRGYNYEVENAIIETVAASKAYVNVTNHLDIRSSFVSKVEYIGDPKTVTKE